MLIMIITASVADKLHKSYTYSLSCTFPPPADNTDIYLTASVDKSDDSSVVFWFCERVNCNAINLLVR